MRFIFSLLAGAILFSAALCASEIPGPAGAPQLKTISPEYVQRGASSEITVTGDFLAPGTQVLINGDPGLSAAIVEATPGKVRLKISATADALVGDREIRLSTPGGVSNPIGFSLSMFPVIQEKEPNNRFDQAQAIELPVMVMGVIHAAAEVDTFKFSAHKDEELAFNVLAARIGSKLDAALRLYDSAGHEVAAGGDNADTDAIIQYKVAKDGDYFLQLHDVKYMGGGDFNYRLTVGRIPFADAIFPMGAQRGKPVEITFSGQNLESGAKLTLNLDAAAPLGRMDVRANTPMGPTNAMAFEVSDLPEFLEKEPNNTFENATTVSVPGIANGRINEKRDVDMYKFHADKGQKLLFEIISGRLGSPLDPLLTLTNAKGDVLVQNETDGKFEHTFGEAADYAISVRDLDDRSGNALVYRLAIQPPASAQPNFSVRFMPDRLAVSRGSRSMAWCEVVRDGGFDGDVTLSIEGLPKGVSCEPATFAAKPDASGLVALSAAADAELGSFPIRLVANSKFKDQNITRAGEAEYNLQTVRQAYVTVLPGAAFTIEPVETGTEEDLKSIQGEITELEKKLDTATPEFTAALAKWEAAQVGGTKWTALEAEKLISAAYAKTDKRPDGSIIVSGGNPAKDTYKLVVRTKLRGITAFQLEALSDPALPAQGPGRAENGNFVLTHFKVDAAALTDENKIVNIAFSKATADFSQDGWPVENSLLGKPDAGWAISPQFGKTHTALYECAKPIDYEGGALLTISLDHASVHNQHTLGCFRVSVTTDKTLAGGGKILPANVRAALETPADKRDAQQKKDAGAYFKSIDPEFKKIEERVAALKAAQAVHYPPSIHRGTPASLGVKIRRAEGFKGDITVSVEGYSAGRDPMTKKPNLIAKNVDVKPMTLGPDQSLAVLSLRAVPKGETGTRTIVVKAEAKNGAATQSEYSKLIPLTIGAAGPGTKPKDADKVPELAAGLEFHYFEDKYDLIPDFDGLKPKESGVVEKFDLSKKKREENYGFKFTGFIDIVTEGNYSFFTSSDDGSRLYIGPYEVVDNDGLHGAVEVKGEIKLKPGKHAITVHFFQQGGGAGLDVSYEGPKVAKQVIPANVLFHKK